jgi:hypothetical protein
MLRQLRSGRCDLVLDRFRGTLELPATQGRGSKLVVPTGKIISIEAEVECRSSGKNNVSPNHFTALGWEDEQGELCSARLMRWGTASEAKDFAAWLQEQVPSLRLTGEQAPR